MKAIEILVKEHDSILKMIEITQKIFADHKDKTKINIQHMEQILDFIKNFADKYHHLKEEDVLFMEMEKLGMPREGGPIGVMLMEHDEGREYIRIASESVEKIKSGNWKDWDELEDNLLNYCELLISHIHKENQILYPMAERILPTDLQTEMAENFENSNASTSNNEYFDKYLKLVDELSAIYLSD
ncbi:MAG: hemerythrin domain-containing protein [Bacteroidetes bacterium]|nr:hemerythrin domain-containing protein [Bacteroidota bacterium]MBL6963468.1 hemerythrin domain-containing protein [Bacteroidota bacterium]